MPIPFRAYRAETLPPGRTLVGYLCEYTLDPAYHDEPTDPDKARGGSLQLWLDAGEIYFVEMKFDGVFLRPRELGEAAVLRWAREKH